jgi:putative endonuclease
MNKNFYIYILSSKERGTLYVGVTSNLPKRVYEHKNGLVEGFTKKYSVHRLVYYEVATDAETALTRERQIKRWNRAWKLRLIEERNPGWTDLYDNII